MQGATPQEYRKQVICVYAHWGIYKKNKVDNVDRTVKRPTLLMKLVRRRLAEAKPFRQLTARLQEGPLGEPVVFTRAAGSLTALISGLLCDQMRVSILHIAPDIRAAERARDDVRSLLGEDMALLLPPRSPIPYDPFEQNPRFDERAAAIEKLIGQGPVVFIAVPAALAEQQDELHEQAGRLLKFKVGDEIDREALFAVLGEAGMKREIRAEEPGQFAVRGAVVDIFPPAIDKPVRLELFGDEIEEMRSYDPVNQRSGDTTSRVTFFAGEKAPVSTGVGLWQLLPDNSLVFIDDPDALDAGIDRTWEEIEYQFEKRRQLEKDRYTPRPGSLYLEKTEILAGLGKFTTVIHRGPAASRSGALVFSARSHESYLGDLESLVESLKRNRGEGLENFILCDRESQVERLDELLEDHGVTQDLARIGVGALHEGFSWSTAGIALLTDHQIFGRHKRTAPFRRRRHRVDPKELERLRKGDYVVHTEFGIGRFLGPKTIQIGGTDRECLQIEYRDGVKVYIRFDQFSKLQKFQGTAGAAPKLSRIGGSDWSRSKSRTRQAVEEVAKEILDIYARRQVEGGFTFTEDTTWQREMEAAFEFDETPDQLSAVNAVKQDMEKPVAMDRLLLGDVGFGKTEVAVRAAFKAVQDSRQVAVLVPTTILAQQHFSTFKERLLKYPIRIEALSRFRSHREQRGIIDGLSGGEVDIVVGTHRLLSKDINFRNLGLIIIDEEHRFGVKHKEKLKRLRATVDVLTMSATPIPRTLNMALSGARDMSMIATAPLDRLPIETEIVPFDKRVIREAIIREVARGGQVYYIHNRVQGIMATKRMIQKLVPGVEVAIAHGKMKERELEKVMEDFLHERCQVLVCTMIIESGLDIPNVNTLIINRADHLGLAQLYQVRGRVGRSHRQAHAYLLTPPRMLLQPDARQRLETIAEHTQLGSGYQIAMRDLEMRGAGNLLGPQQSGFINQVGFELYSQMLAEAVQSLSEQGVAELPETVHAPDPRDVKVDAKINAMLPADYIEDSAERVDLYRRISRTRHYEEVADLRDEIRDRFGPLPREALHLLSIVGVQALAAIVKVARIDVDDDVALVEFADDWGRERFEAAIAQLLERTDKMPIELRGSKNLSLRLSLEDCENWQSRWSRLELLLKSLPET